MSDSIYVNHPVERNITPLYGLAPRGLGTGQIESLHSYVLSLAYAHCISPTKLVSDVLYPLLLRTQRPIVMDLSWRTRQGKNLLGGTELAADWLQVLSCGTGRTDLGCTTLNPLHRHINGEGLFSDTFRHCQECLRADIEKMQPPYRRLIWHLKENGTYFGLSA